MPATSPWLASAEAVLNRNIAASSQAAALAQRLDGTSLQIEIQGLARIRASVFAGHLALMTGDGAPGATPAPAPDAEISGSVPALLQMMRAARPSEQSKVSVQIRGNAETANVYRELFAAARPDLEEELSRWIGDLPARRLSEMARSVRAWARRARRTAGENITEYLQEEGRDLVTKTEMEEFLRGVDGVRETVDRIDARLKRLEQPFRGGT